MEIIKPKSVQPIPEHAKLVFKGEIFDVYQWEQEMYDGSKKTFEKLKRYDSVAVFPVLDDGKILLTTQSQPGREEFIDAPSGRVDAGEDVLEAAKRELLEETGYIAEEYILWKAVQPIGKIDWAVYAFVAKKCRKIKEQEVDAGEKITLKECTFDEMLDLARNNKFRAQEAIRDFLEAKIDPEKYNELKKIFSPFVVK